MTKDWERAGQTLCVSWPNIDSCAGAWFLPCETDHPEQIILKLFPTFNICNS